MHELALTRDHSLNYVAGEITKASFLTLTFEDEHLPKPNPVVSKRDWQLFAKKLRENMGPFRFLMCGEYGSGKHTERPHYHAVIFGIDFDRDRKYYKKNEQGNTLFTSTELDKAWPHGFSTIGDVSFHSVSYVAGYIQKRVNGELAAGHYRRLNKTTGEIYEQAPEFALMSRGDNSGDSVTGYGLGHGWIEKYHKEVYPADSVIVNGVEASPPDYYDRWYAKHFPSEWEEVKKQRELNGKKYEEDNSPARLAVRKKVFTALYGQKQRDKWNQ